MRKNIRLCITLVGIAMLTGCGREALAHEELTESKKTAETTKTETTKTETTKTETTKTETSDIETQVQETTTQFVSDQVYDFSGCAFIGDSRTQGLDEKGVTSGADFYALRGVCVNEVLEEKGFTLSDGSEGTLLQALSGKKYKNIYIMYGINELGWPYKDVFENYYIEIVNKVKSIDPDATIYIQANLPMVTKRSDDVYNNDKINLFNTYVKEIAQKTKSKYIDVGVSVRDKMGALPENGSNDGIHLNEEYCGKWAAYLYNKTINK